MYPPCHERSEHLLAAGTVLSFLAWQPLFAAHSRPSWHFSLPVLLPTILALVQEAVWLASALSLDNSTPLSLSIHCLSPSCMGWGMGYVRQRMGSVAGCSSGLKTGDKKEGGGDRREAGTGGRRRQEGGGDHAELQEQTTLPLPDILLPETAKCPHTALSFILPVIGM